MCFIDTVRELISLTNVHNLSEIEIHQDRTRVRIKRSEPAPQISHSFEIVGGAAAFSHYPGYAGVTEGTLKPGLWHSGALPPSGEDFRTPYREVTSPMVGTFYRSLKTGSKPCVDIGEEVDSDTMVGVIETMKIINDVHAGVTGKVVEVFVEDGEAVEFGQPLFRVQTCLSEER